MEEELNLKASGQGGQGRPAGAGLLCGPLHRRRGAQACFRPPHPFFPSGVTGLAGRSACFISGKRCWGLSSSGAARPSGDVPSPAWPRRVHRTHPQMPAPSGSPTAHTQTHSHTARHACTCTAGHADTAGHIQPPDPLTQGQPLSHRRHWVHTHPPMPPTAPALHPPQHFGVIKVPFEGAYNFY